MACLLNYWSIVVPTKSANELQAERWLVVVPVSTSDYARMHWVLFSRWQLFAVCFGTQVCCGSLYAFVVISDALDVYFYGQVTKQSYSIVLIFMGVTAALLGPMLERKRPRVGMAMATVLITLGFVVSQLAVVVHSPILLTFGYSCLCGMGFGVAIIATISSVQKWFPDLRGLASGFCLLGFGLGNGVCSLVYSRLLHRETIYDPTFQIDGVTNLFWSTGTVVVLMLITCTLVIRTPPISFSMNGQDIHCVPVNMAPDPRVIQDEYLKVGKHRMTLVNYSAVHHELEGTDGHYFQQVRAMTLLQCILSTDFIFLYIAFAANVIPLLVFVPQIVSLAAGMWHLPPSEVNKVLIQAFVGNTLGRFMAPLISDGLVRLLYVNPALMRKLVFTALLTIQICAFALVISDWSSPRRVQWLASIVTFASGGGLAMMPCFITDMFGVYHLGTMYGLILTSYSLGGVVVGYATTTSSMQVTLETLSQQSQAMLQLVLCGLLVMLFVRTNSTDRFYRGYQYSACGKVLLQVAFRRPISETCVEDDSVVILDEPTPPPMPRTFTLWNEDLDGAKYNI
ncbi:hypothetical protein H257_09067 [Aphanomyces astaci]|uniref:Major facilitator superfamily (MFS) profile domain-containing protein n=1 Tax=Aphanomyces astaci TaxID=112090 RepID=W4GD29_APHAT|nr:hypothetical protein H257_09067 [Aphanomyces astaci]ETV77181.1 hypothetical protein H257_09067 [Aphanomyces astaci]|eukprot:XP_009833487.1 hypothetical protein H257_09067 [Aphanomyces astaci]